MEVDDLFNLKLIKEIKLLPNGNNVLLSISESDEKLDKRITHFWMTDLNGVEPVKITNTDQGESYPQFMGKSKICYLATNKGKQNIFVFDQSTGKQELLVSHTASVNAFCFSKDNKSVYFIAPVEKTDEKGLLPGFFMIDSVYPKSLLWKQDLESGKKEIVSPRDLHVKSMNMSPNGKSMVLTMAPSALPNDEIWSEIYLLNLDDHKLKQTTFNGVQEKSVSWSPDGKKLMFVCDANKNMEIYYQHNLFLLGIDETNPKILLEDLKYEINSACYNKKGTGIYYLANMGTRLNLFYYDLHAGINSQLTNEDAVISKMYFDTRFDFMLCTISRADEPDDIYQLDLNGKIKRKLTFLNTSLSQIKLGKSKVVTWKSNDGVSCEGVLYLPSDYDSTAKYPLLVQLHGGPAGSFNLSFPTDYYSYAHILTGKGYIVFQPNYRGSTGYGDECMRSVIGHYFEKDVDDVISGIKYLVNSWSVDSNRVGVFGWSAGGHLTNWLITHYNIFKAASSGAGMCDWISFYGTTEVKYLREIWFNGTPYEKYDDYLRKSPVMYAKNATTPTLLLCGELDKRVPLSQSEEMYTALKKAGCTTELIVFPDNGHGLWQISKQKIKIKKEMDWFDKYLK